MSGFFSTLWDMVADAVKPAKKPGPPSPVAPAPKPRREPAVRKPKRAKTAGGKRERFEAIARDQLGRYEIRVRKWRRAMSGIAWYVTYQDGRVQRLIEAPRPKTEMSLAILLHEVGHHAIGFHTYKPRCLEEYHAWQYAFRTMAEYGVELTPPVARRYAASMRYAVAKASRRGIKSIPEELREFAQST